jgi:hypothetical protein
MEKQDLSKLQTRKMKGLKKRKADADTDADADADAKEEQAEVQED